MPLFGFFMPFVRLFIRRFFRRRGAVNIFATIGAVRRGGCTKKRGDGEIPPAVRTDQKPSSLGICRVSTATSHPAMREGGAYAPEGVLVPRLHANRCLVDRGREDRQKENAVPRKQKTPSPAARSPFPREDGFYAIFRQYPIMLPVFTYRRGCRTACGGVTKKDGYTFPFSVMSPKAILQPR